MTKKTDVEKKQDGDSIEDYLPMFNVDLDDFELYTTKTCEICLCDAPLTPCEMTKNDVILLCQACSMTPIGDILFRGAPAYNQNLVAIADMLAHVSNLFINNIKVLEEKIEDIEGSLDIIEEDTNKLQDIDTKLQGIETSIDLIENDKESLILRP
ncbi:MAG: hypothetical protein GTN99_02870 [Candidatus Dadabacteria bacterium]|nr:hypothetical protein [Candidatus Dadabacteria bacterium]